MTDGCEGFAPADDSGAHAPGAGTVVRHAAAGPRVDGLDYGGGTGTGSPYHRRWAAAFGEGGPAALIFEQSGGSPPLSARRNRWR